MPPINFTPLEIIAMTLLPYVLAALPPRLSVALVGMVSVFLLIVTMRILLYLTS